MNVWIIAFLLLPLFLNSEITWKTDTPEPFSVAIHIKQQQITTEDVIDLEAIFQYPPAYKLDGETLIDQLMWTGNPLSPQFAIAKSEMSEQAKDEMQLFTLQAKLSPLKTGVIQLSFLIVHFVPEKSGAEAAPIAILTPVFTIDVEAAAKSFAKPLSSAPLAFLEPQFPMDLTLANRELLIDGPDRLAAEMERNRELIEKHTFPWLSLSVLLALGGFGWIGYLIRDYLPVRRPKEKVPLHSKQKAAIALQQLENKPWLKQSNFKIYYAELTAIILTALQESSSINFTGLTTLEIENVLKEFPSLSSSQKNDLLSLLKEADQIKFARRQATLEEVQNAFQRGVQLVASF